MLWQVANEMVTAMTKSPIDEILQSRGYNKNFLNPDIKNLHDPMLMKDMDLAIERTIKAINNKEYIYIFGDYDADGITSTYTMVTLLTEADANVNYDIPDRSAGYGMNKDMIDKAHNKGCTLIITCDNGITCVDEVTYAKSLGIDVIITDHHEPQDIIPDTIVVNPKQSSCNYPFKELAGCAVAWKFCQAVLSQLHPAGWTKSLDMLEIVAIGTIADVMPLIDENRIIATFGLKQANKTNIVGLQQLFKSLEVDKREIDAGTIGFQVAPALNATGRLISAQEAVDMLLEQSRLKAMRSAKYLAELNKERKEITKQFATEILEEIDSSDKVILHKKDGIPEGIIGIIASRLKEELNKPVMLMTNNGDIYKGSGRSIEGYDMFAHLMKHKGLFEKVGGHEMACGFSVKEDNIDILRNMLNQECKLKDEDMRKKLSIDFDVEPDLLTFEFAEELEQLKPFGKGNSKPLFQITDLEVLEYKFIGADKTHLKLKLADGQLTFNCIGFSMVEQFKKMQQDTEEFPLIDIACYPGINEWNGRRTLQLEIKDIRAAEI